jgi:Zn-finger nucleic acid-binding protein
MTRPLCPQCREKMSSVEIGLDGVWSCLYCEGTWLSANQVDTLIAQSGTFDGAQTWSTQYACLRDMNPALRCPSCETASFADTACGPEMASCCTGCHSLFFKAGVLGRLAAKYESTCAMPMTEEQAIDTGTAVLLQLGVGLVFALVSG